MKASENREVQSNVIYLQSSNHIVWTGEMSEQVGKACVFDRHYTGQYYKIEDIVGCRTLCLEEAIAQDFIDCRRFRLMNSEDKRRVVMAMFGIKGIAGTMNFVAGAEVVSEEEITQLSRQT